MFKNSAMIVILVVTALALVAGGLGLGLGYLVINSRESATVIPTPVVVVPTNVGDATTVEPTVSPTADAGATTESPTTEPEATAEPETTSEPASTAIPVASTSVQYVMALSNVNMRSGPGTGYNVIGWVADGQAAKVTGVSSDGDWWRVICPDDTVGSCWVTAASRYTQPTTAPGSQPTATPAPTACSDAAVLVADITVPDNTQFTPNAGFVKTWRIRNSGTCSWDGRYRLVHAGGHPLGVSATAFPLPGVVAPGQFIDLSLNMVAPTTANVYQSDWKLLNPAGVAFGVGRNANGPFWAKIVVVDPQPTTISGIVYQDLNLNGVLNSGEPTVAGREVWLALGTACHVRANAIAVTVSGSDGRYVLRGDFGGSYCVGLPGTNGLEDVVGVAVTAGQTLDNIHLKAQFTTGSITGWLWDDYCLAINEPGHIAVLDGNCVADGNGGYRADGMIQSTELYLPGVTIRLQAGACTGQEYLNAMATAVTDGSGRYRFSGLQAGTYCVFMNAAETPNGGLLLPGDWTFPQPGIWYQTVTLRTGEQVAPVNFGWDFQLH
jgi:uncharacterized protein YraI